MHILQEIFKDGDFKTRSYSGRGMYGKECLGVECNDIKDIVYELVDYILATSEMSYENNVSIKRSVRNLCTDQLGLGMIVYFPNVEFESNESENDESESD